MPFTIVPDKSAGDVFSEQMWDSFIAANLNTGVVRPVAEVELGISAASIDLTSIAADWMHLLIVLHARGDTAAATTTFAARLNGDTSGNYDVQALTGQGNATAASDVPGATSLTLGTIPAGSAAAGLFGGAYMFVPHYANASHNKMVLVLQGGKWGVATGNLAVQARAGFWRSSAAINQITLLAAAGNFVAGSMATLYGMGGI